MNKNKLIGSALALIMTTSALLAAGDLNKCLAERAACKNKANELSYLPSRGLATVICENRFRACVVGDAIPKGSNLIFDAYSFDGMDYFDEAMLMWEP
jgi:hypothetical protein